MTMAFSGEQKEPVEILPHLYLGTEAHASQKPILEKLGIR